MISAAEALARLREGNRRFAEGTPLSADRLSHARREEVLASQEPFAIILGCSDSRVPATLIFNQGLGDLFVIRVAGNIVTPSQVGSVEFAAARFGTPLAVVLGHSNCGAVTATLEDRRARGSQSKSLRYIVDRVGRSIESVFTGPPGASAEELLERAIRANIRSSVEQLRTASPLLREMILNGRLVIAGAEYSLKTGLVSFLQE